MSALDQFKIEVPNGTEKAVLDILRIHAPGRGYAVGRRKLLGLVVTYWGINLSERQLRESIRLLRRRGVIICSAAGDGGGYYCPANKREFEEFLRREYLAKIADMQETVEALRQAAAVKYAGQQELFEESRDG